MRCGMKRSVGTKNNKDACGSTARFVPPRRHADGRCALARRYSGSRHSTASTAQASPASWLSRSSAVSWKLIQAICGARGGSGWFMQMRSRRDSERRNATWLFPPPTLPSSSPTTCRLPQPGAPLSCLGRPRVQQMVAFRPGCQAAPQSPLPPSEGCCCC